jgi:hypothetical protein
LYHYFSPTVKADILQGSFKFLENILGTHTFLVVLFGDFNIPSFDWKYGLSESNCHYYSKQKRDVICASTCALGLSQCNGSEVGTNFFVSYNCHGLDKSPLPNQSPGICKLQRCQATTANKICRTEWY